MLRRTKLSFFTCVAGCLLLFSAGCVEKKPSSSQDKRNERVISMSGVKKQIAEQNNKFMETLRNGNLEAFSTLYIGESGKMMPPFREAVTGRDSIMALMKEYRIQGMYNMELTTRELYPHDNHAIEIGEYQILQDDATVVDRGKYMRYWKRSYGKWRIYRDIWNSNNPGGFVP